MSPQNGVQFRQSLEKRLQNLAKARSIDLQRLRRRVAFDQFLARIFSQTPPHYLLKGGYAIESIFLHSRATRDIDLACASKRYNPIEEEALLHSLRSLAEIDLNDGFLFGIEKAKKSLETPLYGGMRFPVSSFVGGRLFVPFSLDVSQDVRLKEYQTTVGENWLSFIGKPPPTFFMTTFEQQIAEKLHAYSMPRSATNSRVKDLVDLALILREDKIDLVIARQTIIQTFNVRKTHPLPVTLAQPPSEWRTPFRSMANECQLHLELEDAFLLITQFYQNHIKNPSLEAEALIPT
jgi:hypothetical protein